MKSCFSLGGARNGGNRVVVAEVGYALSKYASIFLNDVDIYNACDDAHIVVLAFFALCNVNVENSIKTLDPTHRSGLIRFIKLLIFFIGQFNTIFASL